MKSKDIYLHIPVPCHEDWDKMEVSGDNRYCSNCAKTVIDFTAYSDAQLIEFFSKQKGAVCGHFRNVQLGRRLQPMTPQSRLFPVMLLTVSMLIAAGEVTAQQLPRQTKSATTATTVKQPCKKVSVKKVKPAGINLPGVQVTSYTLESTSSGAVIVEPPLPIRSEEAERVNKLPGGVQKVDSMMVKPRQ